MYIKKTKEYIPYSDIIVSDGENEIICFDSDGIDYKHKEIKYLIASGVGNISKSKKNESNIVKDISYYGYNITGQIVKENFVKVYEFEIEIDEYIPNDLKDRDYIVFDTAKIIIEYL